MFYLLLFAHLVADFVLQPFWLVQRKRHWDGLLIHGGIVLVCMLLVPLFDPAVWALWPVMLGVTLIHVAADWWKVQRADRIIHPPILPFLLDQVIHIGTLAVGLSLVLPAESVWSLAGSPFALPALYGAAYLVAACAAPIAVMILFDPTFTHAALGGRARARGALIGATAVSLALGGGAAALPATLIGYALVVRRPASAHPLDTPLGTLVVLCVAAVVGAALAVTR